MAVTTLADLSGSLNHLPGSHSDPKLLYCSNGGYFIRINDNGTVDGTQIRSDLNIQLQLQAVSKGVVKIEGIKAKRFLAMNEKGELHSMPKPTNDCYFVETVEENNLNTYKSKEYEDRNWYVAIRKNGKTKPGQKTGLHQKAVFFLPMPITSD